VITIIAPGTSMALHAVRPVDIAINMAIATWPADWLASNDPWDAPRKPRLGVITSDLGERFWRERWPDLIIVNARDHYDQGLYFSSESAVLHAQRLAQAAGKMKIVGRGFDLAGARYYDGTEVFPPDSLRVCFEQPTKAETLAERWRRERAALSRLTAAAARSGITVELSP